MEKIKELLSLVNNLEKDAFSFYQKGNRTAGTRVRKNLQQVRALATDIRKEIIERKQAAK